MPVNRLVNANQAPRCQHTRTSGLRCGSPARHGRPYCCFHDSAARRNRDFVLPLVEDAASLQLALNKVLQALVDKLIDQKTANTLLYGLQIAFANIRELKEEQLQDDLERRSLARRQQEEADEEEEQEEEADHGEDLNDEAATEADTAQPETVDIQANADLLTHHLSRSHHLTGSHPDAERSEAEGLVLNTRRLVGDENRCLGMTPIWVLATGKIPTSDESRSLAALSG